MKSTRYLIGLLPLLLLLLLPAPAAAQMCDLTTAAAFRERAGNAANIGDYQAAADDYTCALVLAPEDPDLYNERGIAYYNQRLYSRALEDYEKAIELDPNYSYAYNNRGNVFYVRGDYARAIEDYTRSIELVGDQPEISYYNRGNAYQETGQYELAIEDLTSAIDLNTEYAESYLSRAWAYLVTGDDRSHADFARWIDLNRIDEIEMPLEDAIADGTLTINEGTVYRLSFTADAGQTFSVAAQSAPGEFADPLLVLVDPNGDAIVSDDDSGVNLDAVISQFALPESGDYTLLISHAGGEAYGDVELVVSIAGDASLTSDITEAGSFSTYALYVDETAEVYTTEGDRLNLREGPGLDFEIVGRLERGTLVTLLEGPRKRDGYAWWRVRTEDGQEGWSVERVEEEQTLQMALLTGEEAIVTSGEEKLNVRAQPARGGDLVVQIEDGTQVTLLDEAPVIADNFRWWHIRLEDDTEGWIVDRIGDERMIIPAREVEPASG